MERTNRVVAVFLLISLLALPVAANAWFEVVYECHATQNIPGDPDTPTSCTENSGRNFVASFNGESPNLSFVTIVESALWAILQSPCVGL